MSHIRGLRAEAGLFSALFQARRFIIQAPVWQEISDSREETHNVIINTDPPMKVLALSQARTLESFFPHIDAKGDGIESAYNNQQMDWTGGYWTPGSNAWNFVYMPVNLQGKFEVCYEVFTMTIDGYPTIGSRWCADDDHNFSFEIYCVRNNNLHKYRFCIELLRAFPHSYYSSIQIFDGLFLITMNDPDDEIPETNFLVFNFGKIVREIDIKTQLKNLKADDVGTIKIPAIVGEDSPYARLHKIGADVGNPFCLATNSMIAVDYDRSIGDLMKPDVATSLSRDVAAEVITMLKRVIMAPPVFPEWA